ncbi:hypothetical protein GGF41_006826, partial [Coemansia sp. RSA 2531]
MSNCVSPAQALPSHVLRLIIRRLVREGRFPVDGLLCNMNAIKDMLSVCSAWRQAALEYYWKEPRVIIDERKNTCSVSYQIFPKELRPSHTTKDMVKELRLHVPISKIANGTAHQLLTEFMGEIGALPFVHKLHIRVTHHTSGPEYLEDVANSCAVEFAQLLKSITPSLKVIAVSCDSFTTDLSWDDIERNVTFDEGTLAVFIDSLGNISNNNGVLGLEELRLNKLSSIGNIPEISTL